MLKRTAAEQLAQALTAVGAGGVDFEPELAAKALMRQSAAGARRQEAPGAELSEREKEVLKHLAWGYSNKEIAAEIKVSVKTVETYRARIGEKLGLRGRVEMVQYALRQGWLKEEALPGERAAEVVSGNSLT